MDISVSFLGTVIVTALHDAGYQESTIDQYTKSINALTVFIDELDGTHTPELGAEFTALTTSPGTGRFNAQRRFNFARLVHLINSYLRTGRVDLAPGLVGEAARNRRPPSLSLSTGPGKPKPLYSLR